MEPGGVFFIHTQLPSMNEYIAAMNRNRLAGNRKKQTVEEAICWYIQKAITERTLYPMGDTPCYVVIVWHEKTRKRDVDNIQSAQKFVMDALRKMKILKNDGQRYVRQVFHFVNYKTTGDGATVRLFDATKYKPEFNFVNLTEEVNTEWQI